MAAPESRPNVLWISFEDCSPTYGCYGDKVARTPNLDRLAREGCLWTRAFSTCGVCAPARSAIITGMYAISIGTHHMRTTHTNELFPELPTPYSAVVPHFVRCFPEYLRAAGYYCTNNAKTDYQFDPPFTAWDELGERAHWRNRPDPQQPFFAVFNPTRTHESGMWEENTPDIRFDPADIEVPPQCPDTQRVRRALAKMYTNIETSDKELGDILSQLADDGLAENTIVFHWSDHGPLPRGKRWPYDAGIRVPLIVRWPGHLVSGSVNNELVSTVDLAPTVLSVAGVAVPAHMQGYAFLGPHSSARREYIFASRDRHDESYDMVRAARDARYKYIRNEYPGTPYTTWIPYLNRHPIMQELWTAYRAGTLTGAQRLLFEERRPAEELYDTESDPNELYNLAMEEQHREALVRLRSALAEWRDSVDDLGVISESEMVQAWYPGGVQPWTAPVHAIAIAGGAPAPIPPEDSSASPVPLANPAFVQLQCPTQGASVGYRIETAARPAATQTKAALEHAEDSWKIYSGPVELEPGPQRLRCKAIRIGYRESPERTYSIFVDSANLARSGSPDEQRLG